jgi:hypothetical protein
MINRYDTIASRITTGKGAMIMKGGCDNYGRGVRCIGTLCAPAFPSFLLMIHRSLPAALALVLNERDARCPYSYQA